MTANLSFDCAQRGQLLAAIRAGAWPNGADPELAAHVAACRGCLAEARLASAVTASRGAAIAQAQTPAASAIWWRAQLRRRYAAVQRTGQPLLGAQFFAFAVFVVAAVALVASQARYGLRWLDWFTANPDQTTGWKQTVLSALLPQGGSGIALYLVLPALFAALTLGGVLAYFAAERN